MRNYQRPLFQHRHYAAIADTLANLHDASTSASFAGSVPLWKVEDALCDLFANDNGNFDEERFIKAAHRDPSMNGKDRR